ncbi:E3 ubiquitin-protein ligase DZIP3 [Rhinichthys klamathensis goyatoka]|uniref:E3 ubiquitin-protein ligase DZIP3 n=1 Tax=Rhinichthys klamathensis goyatoka TaxID=3034132 RepID=UPI0024B4B41C|nr:E3 ubiquitin-protein ligase DZIP3 [Rhinichthys klamathensis goyatoka]
MENEEEEDEIFTTLQGGYEGQEDVEEKEEEEPEAERKSSWDIPIPSRSIASRRASLPCPAQLNEMHLSRLHSATVAPSPAHLSHLLQSGEAKPCSRSSHVGNNEVGTQTKGSTGERRPHAIPTIPEVHEPLERKARFRSRNVMSLSDADSLCLICHDNLRKGVGGIRELHCSHSFHSECIEEWLWSKQACPTCQKHVAMPEPLYWTSTRVIVP